MSTGSRNRCWSVLLAMLAFAIVPAWGQQKPLLGSATGVPAARVQSAVASTPDLATIAWSVLRAGVTARRGSDRSDSIAALSSIGPDQRAIQLIESRLSDKDASVREKAVAALDNLQVRDAIGKLRAALDDPSQAVSFTAAKALWDMGDPTGRNVLIGVLQGKRGASAGVLQSQLRQTTDQLRSPFTVGLLGAQEAAGVFFGPAALGVAVLGQMLRDHGAPTRAFCAEMLGLDPSPQATAALARAARDKNWMVRASAAEGLGNVDRPNSMATLQALLRDRKPPVRYMAAAAVIRLQIAKAPAQPTAANVATK